MAHTYLTVLVFISTLGACGPAQAPLPLTAPIPETRTLPAGVRIVLADADLQHVAETVRIVAGKSLDVMAAPWPIVDGAGHVVGALATSLEVLAGPVTWPQPSRVQLEFTVDTALIPLAISVPGQAACGVTWAAQAGHVVIQIEVTRGDEGAVEVILAAQPSVTWQSHGLTGSVACLQPAGGTAHTSLDAHLLEVVRAALAPRLAQASLQVLSTIFPPQLEIAGRLPVASRWGDPLEVRVSLQYESSQAQTDSLVHHDGDRALATLTVGLDVDRAACAVDVPPPQWAVGPLPPQPPTPPGETAFLRRALVFDQATLAHAGWALARGGALCQETSAVLPGLTAAWAADLLPALGDWVDGPPVGARFWPTASPELKWLDTPEGPALQWRIARATLEIVGKIADTELVVLSITGGFRAVVRPVLHGGGGLGLKLMASELLFSSDVDKPVVTSPLLGDVVDADKHLGPLVDAAMRGIFQAPPVLPLGLVLPLGTVATGVARTGDALWLWLEGGSVSLKTPP